MSFSLVCTGCGAPLQMDTEGERGFITSEAFMRDKPLCRRCYRLIHYGQMESVQIGEQEYRTTVMRALAKPSLILYVLDAFDMAGSAVRGLAGVINQHEVIAVANKIDLYPHGSSRDKLRQWLSREALRLQIAHRAMLPVSAETGEGFDALHEMVSRVAGDRPVVVMGMANVGKSTVLNRLLAMAGDVQERSVTASPFPGTTLGAIAIKVAGGLHIVDTPGLIGRHRLQDRVCGKSLGLILPKAALRPRVFQLEPGQTIYIGGLARVDFEQGEAQSFVVYAANQLHVHRTKLARADELYRQHLGSLLTPPCPECADDLRGLVATPIRVKGERPVDVALPGLGWVRVGAAASLTVHAPQGITPAVRPAVFGVAERGHGGSGRRAARFGGARSVNPSGLRTVFAKRGESASGGRGGSGTRGASTAGRHSGPATRGGKRP